MPSSFNLQKWKKKVHERHIITDGVVPQKAKNFTGQHIYYEHDEPGYLSQTVLLLPLCILSRDQGKYSFLRHVRQAHLSLPTSEDVSKVCSHHMGILTGNAITTSQAYCYQRRLYFDIGLKLTWMSTKGESRFYLGSYWIHRSQYIW